jgi:hypothetical protein
VRVTIPIGTGRHDSDVRPGDGPDAERDLPLQNAIFLELIHFKLASPRTAHTDLNRALS